MLSLENYLFDHSIVYHSGMSDDELNRRLSLLEDDNAERDQYLFAAVPTTDGRVQIKTFIDQLQWQQAHRPYILPLQSIHLSIRFDKNFLVSHIEELKRQIDSLERFRQPTQLPVVSARRMGTHEPPSLFGFEFVMTDGLKKAAEIFDMYLFALTRQKRIYKFKPHMLLAKYVKETPKGVEHAPPALNFYYTIARGILAVSDPAF